MEMNKHLENSDDEEEQIQMDDKLSEEIEDIQQNNSNPSTQIYNSNTFYPNKTSPQNNQNTQQPTKKSGQVITLELNNSPQNNSPSQIQANQNQQPQQSEAITLKEKLLNIFTNMGTNSQQSQSQNIPKKINNGLQLEENIVDNKPKASETHHFQIDHDMELFEDDLPEQENKNNDKDLLQDNKIGNITPFEEEDEQIKEIEADRNSRKNSEDYIQILDNKNNNYDMLGKQLTEYENHMLQIANQEKQQEFDIQQSRQLLSQYDNIKIIKMDQFYPPSIKEVHSINAQQLQKGKNISIDENILFKGTKAPKKKRGLFEFITNRVTRYILLQDEHIAFLKRNKKNDFTVCSSIPLTDLFQIFNDKNSTQMRLYFVNKQRSQLALPINKLYNIDNKDQFIVSLRKTLNIIGLDYALK